MTRCPEPGVLVQERIDQYITQYREAWKFKGMSTAYLDPVDQVLLAVCDILNHFDIDTAIGDQLTIIGKWLGFPRCHCICDPAPVFGFSCEGQASSLIDIAGFCENGSSWINCQDVGNGTICIDDDDLYRRFLYARRYQFLGLYDIESLTNAVRHIWGGRASIVDSGNCEVIISPGRNLSDFEFMMLPVALRVLPIAPGIKLSIQDPAQADGLIFGFGSGWGGLCEGAVWLCPIEIDPYNCDWKGNVING